MGRCEASGVDRAAAEGVREEIVLEARRHSHRREREGESSDGGDRRHRVGEVRRRVVLLLYNRT